MDLLLMDLAVVTFLNVECKDNHQKIATAIGSVTVKATAVTIYSNLLTADVSKELAAG